MLRRLPELLSCVAKATGRRTPPRAPSAAIERLETRELLTVTYHGGPLLPQVEVQPIFVGSDWATSSSLQSQATQLQQFNSFLTNSPYMDMLSSAGYNVGRGSADDGVTVGVHLNKSRFLTDAALRAGLQAEITNGQFAAPDPNRVYVLYIEPGVAIKDSDGTTSINSFLGYHDQFQGTDPQGNHVPIRYAVIAYPGGINGSPRGEGFNTNFDWLTSVTSHEVTEAATDPDGRTGWFVSGGVHAGEEISDVAAGHNVLLNGYCVQMAVNKAEHLISPAGSSPYTPAGTAFAATAPATSFEPHTAAHHASHDAASDTPHNLDALFAQDPHTLLTALAT
jgi:hypothetical protein